MENWDLRNSFERLRGRQIQLNKDLSESIQELKDKGLEYENTIKAREVIREVAVQTQEQLAFHVQDIVTSAILGVFPNPYVFKADFVMNNNRTECKLGLLSNDGEVINPLNASGGGVVDVTAFALRIASWSMKVPRSRPVIILDETFKHLSRDLMPKAGEMLRGMADKLNMQVIMITHEPDLVQVADKVFEVHKDKIGMSRVVVL